MLYADIHTVCCWPTYCFLRATVSSSTAPYYRNLIGIISSHAVPPPVRLFSPHWNISGWKCTAFVLTRWQNNEWHSKSNGFSSFLPLISLPPFVHFGSKIRVVCSGGEFGKFFNPHPQRRQTHPSKAALQQVFSADRVDIFFIFTRMTPQQVRAVCLTDAGDEQSTRQTFILILTLSVFDC